MDVIDKNNGKRVKYWSYHSQKFLTRKKRIKLVCGSCKHDVNRINHMYYCGFCGEKLEWK